MIGVAKLMLQTGDGKLLLLHRSNHPSLPNDPDLPGGTLEKNEEPIAALLREVSEEIGIKFDSKSVELVFQSDKYESGRIYYLYKSLCRVKPNIIISWEHTDYQWLDLKDFTSQSHLAKDHYMHMVYDYLSQNN
ncbi:MAG: NUDIX hydrolase [Candidatus Saccharimonadales bacterium]